MGDVFFAFDEKTSRPVAIKRIRSDLAHDLQFRKRIDREASLHGSMRSHPYIVTLYDRFEHEGIIYLVLEFVDGKTLRDFLSHAEYPGRLLPPSVGMTCVDQALSAIEALHAESVIHRDLKTVNIMVCRTDWGGLTCKLLDFGIAKNYLSDDSSDALTRTGASPGTKHYMAPEQYNPAEFGPVGPYTDVYAMGVVLFECLTGGLPFVGNSMQVMFAHLSTPVPDLPGDLGSRLGGLGLQEIVGRAMAKSPKDRYQTAAEFRRALGAVLPDALRRDEALLQAPALEWAAGILEKHPEERTGALATKASSVGSSDVTVSDAPDGTTLEAAGRAYSPPEAWTVGPATEAIGPPPPADPTRPDTTVQAPPRPAPPPPPSPPAAAPPTTQRHTVGIGVGIGAGLAVGLLALGGWALVSTRPADPTPAVSTGPLASEGPLPVESEATAPPTAEAPAIASLSHPTPSPPPSTDSDLLLHDSSPKPEASTAFPEVIAASPTEDSVMASKPTPQPGGPVTAVPSEPMIFRLPVPVVAATVTPVPRPTADPFDAVLYGPPPSDFRPDAVGYTSGVGGAGLGFGGMPVWDTGAESLVIDILNESSARHGRYRYGTHDNFVERLTARDDD